VSFTATYQAIMDRFVVQWATLQPAVRVAYPNMAFTPTPGTAWVRVTVVPDPHSQQAAIGGTRLWRNRGLVIVQVFTPQGAGDEAALALGDSVTTAMRGVTISGLRLKATGLLRVGNDQQWLQYNAETPYEYDDVTA